jgi:hypothetical protein
VIISATWKDSRRRQREIFLTINGKIVKGWEMVYSTKEDFRCQYFVQLGKFAACGGK